MNKIDEIDKKAITNDFNNNVNGETAGELE